MFIQAGHTGRYPEIRRFLTGWRSLNAARSLTYLKDCKFTTIRKMMVETGASANAKGGPVVDVLPEKDDDGGYASGGWKR